MLVELMIAAQVATTAGVVYNHNESQAIIKQVNVNSSSIVIMDKDIKSINGAVITNQDAIKALLNKDK